jgi:hypothetical protein
MDALQQQVQRQVAIGHRRDCKELITCHDRDKNRGC